MPAALMAKIRRQFAQLKVACEAGLDEIAQAPRLFC
jgi:hypothetical protein